MHQKRLAGLGSTGGAYNAPQSLRPSSWNYGVVVWKRKSEGVNRRGQGGRGEGRAEGRGGEQGGKG